MSTTDLPHPMIAPAVEALPPGARLKRERYVIEELLGCDLFTLRYRAFDQERQESVVIEEYFPSDRRICHRLEGQAMIASTPGSPVFARGRDQFRALSRALTRFRHPGVTPCLDRFVAYQTEYRVMGRIDTLPLRDWLKRQPPATSRVLPLYRKLVEALEALHHAGLTHGNLHPGNIGIRPEDGQPIVHGFGPSRLAGDDGSMSFAQVSGYSPPERFHPSDTPSPAEDIYSLGALLYCLIWHSDPPAFAQRLSGRQLRWPKDLPAPVRDCVEGMMALDPGQRVRDLHQMSVALSGRFDAPAATAEAPLADSRFEDDLSRYRCPVTGLEFVTIAGGHFEMGDHRENPDSSATPVHPVWVATFQMARTPVTQTMWRSVMGDNPAASLVDAFVGDDKPVVNISWDDIQDFIQRLNRQLPDGHYRLPSEAEWEYAARGGAARLSRAQDYLPDAPDDGLNPVAQNPANPLGLFGLFDAPAEWCEDCWSWDHHGAPVIGTARADGECKYRVTRGGFFAPDRNSDPLSSRWFFLDDLEDPGYGFRLVRSVHRR